MRAFGKHIVIIISVLMLSALILEYCYKRAYKSDVARNKVQLVANLKNVHIDYIFLGSSRTENHIDCDVIEKITGKSCINLGLQAGRIKDYRIIVELLQSNAVYFDKLFIQIDYSYNFDDYSKGFLAQLMPFVKNDNLPEVRYQELELPFYYDLPYLRFASNEKKIGFRETLLQWFEKPVNADLNNGFSPLYGVGGAISGHFPEKIASSNEALDDIIEYLEEEKLVLFTAPYCRNGKNRESFMNQLKSRYPTLKDYSSLFDDNGEYFVNCGHLNKEGAQKFTGILTKDIFLD